MRSHTRPDHDLAMAYPWRKSGTSGTPNPSELSENNRKNQTIPIALVIPVEPLLESEKWATSHNKSFCSSKLIWELISKGLHRMEIIFLIDLAIGQPPFTMTN